MSQGRAALLASGVEWRLLSGLVAIQAAISLAWVVYNIYMPDLLKQFGFDPAFGLTLLTIENFIAAFMEPIMGGLSDRQKQNLGSSVPLIVAGIIFASAFFMAIPAVTIFGNPQSMVRWLLPAFALVWATAMAIFRSPAIALLGQCARGSNLAQAFSVLTLTGGAIGALKPLADRFIFSFGAATAFTVSSLAFLAAATLLRFVKSSIPTSDAATRNRTESCPSLQTIVPQLLLLGLLGISIAWSMRLAIGETLPRLIQLEIAGANLQLWMGAIAIGLAVFAIPAGWLAAKLGNELVTASGCLGAALLLGLMSIVHGAIATIVSIALLLACLSAVINGTIPLALTATPKSWNGLGVGIYYGGTAAVASIFSLIFPLPERTIAFSSSITMAAIALMGSAIVIAIVNRLKSLLQEQLVL
ncbi:MFS transporter [Pseudanabaena sp. PCC 6802]|uniref:MFS transporter n=1 Tax=Pseudanabaena sp. PCC 6802 TaxID=118173 RepID=UPI000346EE1C|nr:MFS transporter [Pseudanabaena sp. PCC 6802]